MASSYKPGFQGLVSSAEGGLVSLLRSLGLQPRIFSIIYKLQPVTRTSQKWPIKVLISSPINTFSTKNCKWGWQDLMCTMYLCSELWVLHTCRMISTDVRRTRRPKQRIRHLFRLCNRPETSHRHMKKKTKFATLIGLARGHRAHMKRP